VAAATRLLTPQAAEAAEVAAADADGLHTSKRQSWEEKGGAKKAPPFLIPRTSIDWLNRFLTSA
jgi:hypothetical protein